jgi:hypothetical protein
MAFKMHVAYFRREKEGDDYVDVEMVQIRPHECVNIRAARKYFGFSETESKITREAA